MAGVDTSGTSLLLVTSLFYSHSVGTRLSENNKEVVLWRGCMGTHASPWFTCQHTLARHHRIA